MDSVKGIDAILKMLNKVLLYYVAAPMILSLSLSPSSLLGLARIRRQAIASRQQASGGDADDVEEPASDSDSEVSSLSHNYKFCGECLMELKVHNN